MSATEATELAAILAEQLVVDSGATLAWDEVRNDTVTAGWVSFTSGHPDQGHRYYRPHTAGSPGDTCGWYMDYSQYHPDKSWPVLARAYVFRLTGTQCDELGCLWFRTIDEAKAWVERQVSIYLTRK